MRRLLFTVATLLPLLMFSMLSAPECGAAGKDIKKVIRKYDKVECAECINVGSLLLSIAKMSMSDEMDVPFVDGLRGITVFTMEDCDYGKKLSFAAEAAEALQDYEKLMEMKDEDEDMTIYVKMSRSDTIEEFVLFSAEEATLILMSGRMPMSALEEMMSEAR